jgi:hypothetical protein
MLDIALLSFGSLSLAWLGLACVCLALLGVAQLSFAWFAGVGVSGRLLSVSWLFWCVCSPPEHLQGDPLSVSRRLLVVSWRLRRSPGSVSQRLPAYLGVSPSLLPSPRVSSRFLAWLCLA